MSYALSPSLHPTAHPEPLPGCRAGVTGYEASRQQLLDEAMRLGATGQEADTVAPTLDVYKELGGMFISAGAGLMWAFTQSVALNVEPSALLTFPQRRFALQPPNWTNLGPVVGRAPNRC